MKKRNIIIISSVVLMVLFDQLTKILTINNLAIREELNIIDNFFIITHVKNPGIAYGMLEGHMWLLYVVSGLAAGLFYYLLKDVDFVNKKLYSTAIIMMIAGGIGNFIDRIVYKEVTDMFSLIIFDNAIFGVFNVADMFLVIGMVIFAIDVLIEDVLKWKKSS